MGPCESQDLRSPSPIIAPGETYKSNNGTKHMICSHFKRLVNIQKYSHKLKFSMQNDRPWSTLTGLDVFSGKLSSDVHSIVKCKQLES